MTIYERIRELRIKAGMTQEDLAHAMGYKDRSMITKIESGRVDISQTKVIEFAKVLNTTPAYLMGWDVQEIEEALDRAFGADALDDEMVWLWENATPAAKRAAIAVLKSMQEED